MRQLLCVLSMLECPLHPTLGSGMETCSQEGFAPPPEGFVRPAPAQDHGITDGEYDEWFSSPFATSKCQYGTAEWFPESGC
mmetsp:Transcript_37146/g.90206  ORF Transcript_37146/g.90206 Transcript_37146/m.90206 type:complete len:81 (-) Transcript_37146:183-425(-)